MLWEDQMTMILLTLLKKHFKKDNKNIKFSLLN